MKVFFKLLFFAGFCVVFLDGNASKYSINGQKSNEQNELYADEMVLDGTIKVTPDGDDIKLYGTGRINLTLAYGELTFEVCKDCAALSSVCYEADSVINHDLICSDFPSYCNFQVKNDDSEDNAAIKFGKTSVFKNLFDGFCVQNTLPNGDVSGAPGKIMIKSCKPKINSTNKMIKLFIDIKSRCQIKVVNAKLHVPEILTASTKIPSNDPSTEVAFPWWAGLIIGIVVVLAILVIGYIGNYPLVQHDVLECEIQLLCAPVSKMYAEIDSLSRESEQKLTASGCEFDDQRRLVSVPKGARRYLKDKKTAATTVYFAFGAEYSRHLSADSEVLKKASVPLLYVIALQPRFPVESRRKACAVLRRKLCKILGYYKASDRSKMSFPINIVEDAYGKNPKLFFDPSGIKTDSEGDRKKKEADQNGDGKRKKKSTKKRH